MHVLVCICSNVRRGAAIGQVWTRHCRSSRTCPTAFIALSVHHVFIRPLALLVFQTVRRGGGGGWDPKVCVTKMAQKDFPNSKFRLSFSFFFVTQTYMCLVSAQSDGPDQADNQSTTYFVPCETQLACRLQRWDAHLDPVFLTRGKFRLFPLWSLCSWGVGGPRGVPPFLLWCKANLMLP